MIWGNYLTTCIYVRFKTVFEPEEYLDRIIKVTNLLTSFRLSRRHNLAARYRSIDRQDRL